MVFRSDQVELQTAFDFTTDDLYANKNGMITPHQEVKLKSWSNKMIQKKMLAYLLNIGIIGAVAYFYIYKSNRPLNEITSYLPIMVFAGALIISVVMRFYFTRNLRSGKISSTLGVPKSTNYNTKKYTKSSSRIISMDNTRFYLTPQQFDSIDFDCQYQLYYIKSSPYSVILSIEKL
ncbi:MAG: hypothetical protein APR63_07855 [Desulfuromonas sp. SDB]|nr:MAG: hypothetical protein APR63_07855 [Desulfuromonas sp. SDB]